MKPNNILVSKDGRTLKITDFNVAKFCEHYENFDQLKLDNYEMNTYTGTIAFRAPEMLEHKGYHESVDVWAAGCVLFTMLCGHQPFHSEFIIDLIALIKRGQVEFSDECWKFISEDAKDLILKLLQKSPEKRLLP